MNSFNSVDYKSGVDFYKKNGGSKVLLSFFQKGENAFTRKKLREELAKLNSETREVSKVSSPKTVEDKPKYPPEAILLFKERAECHTLMKAQSNDSDRAKLAFRIKAISRRIDLILVPPPVVERPVLPNNPVKLMKLLGNNRSYISKYKNDPMKQGEVKRRLLDNEIIEQTIKINQ